MEPAARSISSPWSSSSLSGQRPARIDSSERFGPGETVRPWSAGSPAPAVPSTTPPRRIEPRRAIGPACDIAELRRDFDGDETADTLLTYAPIETDVSCDEPNLALEYRMSVFLATGDRIDQPVVDCKWRYACLPFAAPDIDGNGRSDIVLQVLAGASTVQVELFAIIGDPWSGTIVHAARLPLTLEECAMNPVRQRVPRGPAVAELAHGSGPATDRDPPAERSTSSTEEDVPSSTSVSAANDPANPRVEPPAQEQGVGSPPRAHGRCSG